MPTIEERLQAIEQEHTQLKQEHAQLKKTTELQTIAIGALVNKATLEQLNEKYDRIFDALMAHDRFTNEQLAELREQLTEQDGKIVGLQTEMRQRFSEQDSKLTGLEGKVTGLEGKVTGLESKVTGLESKVTGLESKVTGLESKVTGLQTEMRQRFGEQDSQLKQILTLLSERQ